MERRGEVCFYCYKNGSSRRIKSFDIDDDRKRWDLFKKLLIYHYLELSNVIDEIDIVSNNSSQVSSARVLSTGNLIDEELSFRENISKSYLKFQRKQSRGRRP